MNKIKTAIATAVLVASPLLAADADAHGRGRAHVGIWFGVPAPIFYPQYHYYPRYEYYPRYYYPPTVVVPAPVYIEQPPPAAPPPPASAPQGSTAYWYYCRESQTYYPYVQSCPSPWQQVVPHSTPPS